MTASARMQDVIAQNLASSSVPGYKKQDVSFSTVAAGLTSTSGQHYTLTRAQTSTSFAPGELRYTGVNTDAAVEGPGFFEVQLPNGNKAYTRDGEFTRNAQGQMVTKRGYPVLTTSGPIQFDHNDAGPVSISSDGVISQGSTPKGRMSIVTFDRQDLLLQGNGGYFHADNPDAGKTQLATPVIRQGFLEDANTSSVAEMANLMTSMRSFEANEKVIQTQDDRMGKAISDLGNPLP
jgi:flagellar basal-body rod protein FlgF